MPSYEWKCRVCDQRNMAGSSTCEHCCANAELSAFQIQMLKNEIDGYFGLLKWYLNSNPLHKQLVYLVVTGVVIALLVWLSIIMQSSVLFSISRLLLLGWVIAFYIHWFATIRIIRDRFTDSKVNTSDQ